MMSWQYRDETRANLGHDGSTSPAVAAAMNFVTPFGAPDSLDVDNDSGNLVPGTNVLLRLKESPP
ncbi:hypothetical protein BDV06DRAFT_191753 [Aspergillus oleicola]